MLKINGNHITKFAGVIIIIFIFVNAPQVVSAQSGDELASIEEYLTPEQQKMLQEERQLIKQNRYQFRKSLSEEQLNILGDESMTQEQKREQLRKTFTKQQKEMLNEQSRRLEQKRKEFRGTLTDEQKLRIRERYQYREGQNQNNDKMNGSKERSGKFENNDNGNKGGR